MKCKSGQVSDLLRLRATWSCFVWVTMNWMTAFLWRFQKSYRAVWLTPPSYRHLLHTTPDSEQMNSSLARCYPFPEAPRTPPRNTLDPAPQKSSWTARQKEEGPESRYRWTTPQAASIVSLAAHLALGAEESVFMDPHGPTIAPRCLTAVIVDKIKHMHFQNIYSNSLARHHSVQWECSSPPRGGHESAGKRSHRNRCSSPERVRLLHPNSLSPKKTAACDLF